VDTPYYTNEEAREKIDEVLEKNAIMFTQLGKDSTKDEIQWAKDKEQTRLKRVHHLDEIFINRMLID
jgi:hypothetical protein